MTQAAMTTAPPSAHFTPGAWQAVIADRDAAEAKGRLHWFDLGDRQGAVGMAFQGDAPFNPDDGVHQIIDNVRWAEWIRDARAAGDYARADDVRAMAERLGQRVSILKGGHVAVVQGYSGGLDGLLAQMIAAHEKANAPQVG